ncbi:MAG: hypothetical protein LBT11_00730 [Treponema sp.]|nr:hypothetical protein [Treponema sp.]
MAEATEMEAPEDDQDEEFHSGKIYCANCIQCKLVPPKVEKETPYGLRIRCAAGKWKKKLGEEKLYKYSTVIRRYVDACDTYEEMGDARKFIRELKKTLLTEQKRGLTSILTAPEGIDSLRRFVVD